jgi:flagellar protein FlaJ
MLKQRLLSVLFDSRGYKIISNIVSKLEKSFPGLRLDLELAGINKKPKEFIHQCIVSAAMFTAGLGLMFFFLMSKFEINLAFLVLVLPLLYSGMFMYMLKTPALSTARKKRDIDAEVLFAGRYLLIEFWSGVPIFDALKSVSKNYGAISHYFGEIVQMVEAGMSIEDAIDKAIETTPSQRLRKVLWQVVNSLRTGSDISNSLEVVLNQIEREQMIEVKGYGRKLNSLALFYMMIAVILPALGGIMLVVVSSFTGIIVNLPILLVVVACLGFIQLMFISVIKTSRPAVAD